MLFRSFASFVFLFYWSFLHLNMPVYAEKLVAPSEETEKVIRVLESIRDGYRLAQAPLENVRVTGLASRITSRDSDEINFANAESVLRPSWHSFELIERDGKLRYEEEYQPGPDKVATEIYRLINPDGMYRYDVGALIVSDLKNMELTWRDYANSFYRHLVVRNYTRFSTIDEMCQDYIDRIQGDKDSRDGVSFLERTGFEIIVDVEEPLITIKVRKRDKKPLYFSKIVVDTSQGYNVVSESEREGNKNSIFCSFIQRDVEFDQIAEGVYFPLKANGIMATLGTSMREQKEDGWIRYDLKVEEIEFGDFPCDESLFQVSSLPIPVGTKVIDNRHTPPNIFNLGTSPLSEEVLENAVKTAPLVASSRSILFWLNVILVVVIASLVVSKQISKLKGMRG